MQPTIQTANQITVPDGVVVYDGREFYIGYGESVNLAIASGTQGMLRNDIVVVEYNRDESSGVESAQFQVIEGTPAASNPQDPAYSDQDIRTGVFTSQKPFCRVVINGTAIQEIQMLVEVSENIEKLMQYISNLEEENTALNSAFAKSNMDVVWVNQEGAYTFPLPIGKMAVVITYHGIYPHYSSSSGISANQLGGDTENENVITSVNNAQHTVSVYNKGDGATQAVILMPRQ